MRFAIALATLAAAQDWETPFNGKDLTGWKPKGDPAKSRWQVGKAALDPSDPRKVVVMEGTELINEAKSEDLYTEKEYGDVEVQLEVMVPKGSNSGVYLMGEYEVQVLDSFGKKKAGKGDMGAVYGVQAPRVNASKAPGEWQTLAIKFRAPRFDAAGKKTENARFIRIELNGETIIEDVEVKGQTGGALHGDKESPKGPLMFQGDHGPVAFRNIKIRPLP